jgi:hypothetical protein
VGEERAGAWGSQLPLRPALRPAARTGRRPRPARELGHAPLAPESPTKTQRRAPRPPAPQDYLAAEEEHRRKLLKAIGPRKVGALAVARAVGMLRDRQKNEVAALLAAMIALPTEHCERRGVAGSGGGGALFGAAVVGAPARA